MGELMRHYWQPVCGVDDLVRSPFRTHEVKVLGEELVLFRDRRGNIGVVDKYCTHRRASLASASSKRTASAVSTTAGSSTARVSASSSPSKTQPTRKITSVASVTSVPIRRRS
jgi:hypothetical protein